MKSTFISKEIVTKALATPPTQGKHPLALFAEYLTASGVPAGTMDILENHEVAKFANATEVHERAADLWIGLEGSVTFIVGGDVVDAKPHAKKPFEIQGTSITGGTEHVLGPGDILHIPAGVPHTHFGSGRLFIIKIPVASPA